MDKKRILVVDDDSSVVAYLEFLLAIYGYSIEGVSSGPEALKKILPVLPGRFWLYYRDGSGYGGVSLITPYSNSKHA